MTDNTKATRPVTNKHVYESVDALRLLDQKTKDGVPRFKFDRVVRISLASKLRLLADLAEVLDKAKNDVREEHKFSGALKDNGQPVDSPDVIKAVNAEWDKVLAGEAEVGEIKKIKMSALNLDVNQIEIAILAALSWLIDNDLEEA